MKKTYIIPKITSSDCEPCGMLATSHVNSSSSGIGYGGGAGSSEPQRTHHFETPWLSED